MINAIVAEWAELTSFRRFTLAATIMVAVLIACAIAGRDTRPDQFLDLGMGLGMGLTGIGLSLRYRMPVVTARSTPGAAILIGSAAGLPLSDAVGAFVLSA